MGDHHLATARTALETSFVDGHTYALYNVFDQNVQVGLSRNKEWHTDGTGA